jgi:hypothetical protein
LVTESNGKSIFDEWTEGDPAICKIPLTKAIRDTTGCGVAEAKAGAGAVVVAEK